APRTGPTAWATGEAAGRAKAGKRLEGEKTPGQIRGKRPEGGDGADEMGRGVVEDVVAHRFEDAIGEIVRTFVLAANHERSGQPLRLVHAHVGRPDRAVRTAAQDDEAILIEILARGEAFEFRAPAADLGVFGILPLPL